MDKNMNIAFLTGILSHVRAFLDTLKALKTLLGKKESPGSNAPPTGGTGNQSVNAKGGIVIVHQNINIIVKPIKYEEVSRRFNCVPLAKDKENDAELVIEWKQSEPEYLAMGLYAYCSFGGKKDLPVWADFQSKEPSKDNTLDNLTFSVALLGSETWEEAGMGRAELDACGYKGKGEKLNYWFDNIKRGADTKILRECFESELKAIGKMLS
jgi:hypothetical protein